MPNEPAAAPETNAPQPGWSYKLPPAPVTEAERTAVAAADAVLARWFPDVGDDGPTLSDLDRELIAREMLTAFSRHGLELRLKAC